MVAMEIIWLETRRHQYLYNSVTVIIIYPQAFKYNSQTSLFIRWPSWQVLIVCAAQPHGCIYKQVKVQFPIMSMELNRGGGHYVGMRVNWQRAKKERAHINDMDSV